MTASAQLWTGAPRKTSARRTAPREVAVVHGQLGYGGSERQLQLFLQACDRRAWSPHVYVAGQLERDADQLRGAGLPLTLLEGSPLQKLWQFRRAFRRQRAVALVSWSSWTNVFSWALIGQRVPRVGSFRNAGFADLPARWRPLWSWASRAHLTTILCNSEETTQELRRRSRRSQRVGFVPNAVEPPLDVAAAREAWRRQLGVSDDEVLVMGIGRLTAQKAFDRFVDAMVLCHASQPVRGVILGPDYEDAGPALLEHIAATGLPPGALRYLGPTDAPREVVCAADVYLLSSTHEGMPNVALEAMAAGVPCVTTSVGGLTSVMTHDVEGLVAGHDARSLADALLRLVEDPGLRRRMGGRALQRVAGAHAPTQVYRPVWDALAAEADEAQAAAAVRVARRTRVADVALCLLAAPVVLPLGAVVAVAVRASSPGPVLHHGVRTGRYGRPFRFHKFRTMHVDAALQGPGITTADDARVTPVGRWLRHSKLDELPQLLNVLSGKMSLVGPRPEDPHYVDLTRPDQRTALSVLPGITSPASLRYRNEQALLVGPDWDRIYREKILPDKLAIDGDYLQHASLRSYAAVIAQTLLTLALAAATRRPHPAPGPARPRPEQK